MSLYRTWRPASFADLVGQDAVVKTLSTALESGKLAHAYLFSGPRGSGKTSAAKILARCINCERGPTATPDLSCEHCQAIAAGTALDVLEIDAASNRGIDEIRALRDAVKFAPATMRKKVYIVDEAHMLTKEGANAFLKTLEEPPPHVVFILATTAPEALPPTILSRCQRYAFRRIAIPVMIDRMRAIAKAEGIAIDGAALAALAYRADGGLRDALTMLEQVAAFSDGNVNSATVEAAFGATGREYARTLLEQMIAADAAGILASIAEANDAGIDMQTLTRSLIADLRHVLVGQLSPQVLRNDLSADDVQALAALGLDVRQTRLVRALTLLSEALGASRGSGLPRLELETALLRFVYDDAAEALAAAPRSAPKAQPKAALPPQPALPPKPMPAPTAEPLAGALSLPKIRGAWEGVKTRIYERKTSLRAPLGRANVAELSDDLLTLAIGDDVQGGILRDNVTLIQEAITEVFGRPLRVVVRIEGAARSAAAGPVTVAENNEDLALLQYAVKRIGGTTP